MAQPIQCDPHNMAHLADWLVTRLADGEVQAYCNDAFLEFVTMAADSAAQNEGEATDTDAMRLLAQAQPYAPEQEAELDAAAVEARIGAEPTEAELNAELDPDIDPRAGGPPPTDDRDDRDDDGRAERDAAPPRTAIEATDDAIREHPLEDIEVQGIGTVPSIDTAHVIRKGRSTKARNAQARRKLAAAGVEVHVDAQGGPDEDEDEDEDEATGDAAPTP